MGPTNINRGVCLVEAEAAGDAFGYRVVLERKDAVKSATWEA